MRIDKKIGETILKEGVIFGCIAIGIYLFICIVSEFKTNPVIQVSPLWFIGMIAFLQKGFVEL